MSSVRKKFAVRIRFGLTLLPIILILAAGLVRAPAALAQDDYVLGPEDKITIRVWGNEDLTTTARISMEGKVLFPFLGEVDAAGSTPLELARKVGRGLADGYIVDPQITVEVIEYKSQKIYVLGEVKSPGAFTLSRQIHLVEAISLASGPTASADRVIMVIRPREPRGGPAMPEDVDPGELIQVRLLDALEGDREQNILVHPGDSIYIPRVKVFYITGEVNKPGRYDYQKHMTVLDAISTAGGLKDTASEKKTRIIRHVDGEQREFRVGLGDPIMPEDTIVVPESFF